jgi:nicotinate-nucleotide pyrophosphorylase (carboxylating)
VFVAPDSSRIIALALAEDFGVAPERFGPNAEGDPALLECDVTSFAAIGLDARFSGTIVARQACVVAGLPVVAEVYDALSAAAGLIDPVEVFPLVAEGTGVRVGTAVAEVEGNAAAVLAGERTALDFLMQLSGMATQTAEWVKAAGGRFEVCDTRKTPPGLRALAKYAVQVGGGSNHRLGLYDMVLVKDNHIRRAGGIAAAVEKARAARPDLLVEVEADSLSQAIEAVAAGADLVLLDNFEDAALKTAVTEVRTVARRAGREVLVEASGGITLSRARALRDSGVDRVSTSALTMGTPVVDFGLDEEPGGGVGA